MSCPPPAAPRAIPTREAYSSEMTSSSESGNLPRARLEKMSFPSATTSKTPPPLAMSSASTPLASLIAAARLAARGL